MIRKLDLKKILGKEKLSELQEHIKVYRSAAEELASLSENLDPQSIDYENLLHENPGLADEIQRRINTLAELRREITRNMFSLGLAALRALLADMPQTECNWEPRIAKRANVTPSWLFLYLAEALNEESPWG